MTFLTKNANKVSNTTGIRMHSVADYLSREQKLELVNEFVSLNQITASKQWHPIVPDSHHDWLNQRDETFDEFIVIGDKKIKQRETLFSNYSVGVKTNRDAWCYNFSVAAMKDSLVQMLNCFASEQARYKTSGLPKDEFSKTLVTDSRKIAWSGGLKSALFSGESLRYNNDSAAHSTYRPFAKQWLYYDAVLNERRYQMPKIFPTAKSENVVICVPGLGETKGFMPLITNCIPNLHFIAGCQCFPLYVYELDEENGLFSDGCSRTDAIADDGLRQVQSAYGKRGDSITKEDLFYYIYGLLHSPEYRERYKDNLRKELPRIPAVKKFEDFQAFAQAGRDLAHWHLEYETVDCHPVTLDFTAGDKGPKSLKACKDEHFYVRKMKFPSKRDPETKKNVKDKTTVIYNDYITVRDIPLEAYDYVVNGKSAIEWVMERQAVTTDKKSGIVNDANLWATETMNNAAYPLELLMRVITVSLETNRIVAGLPKLDID